MAGEVLSYCAKACPDCPVAHLADGSLATDNVYAQFGIEIDPSTPEDKLIEYATQVEAFSPPQIAKAIMRIETGQCPTAP